MKGIFLAAGLMALLAACAAQQGEPSGPDADLKQIARQVAAACPDGVPGPKGRDACADGLARLSLLEKSVSPTEGIRWGGTAKPGDYEPSHNKLTKLDALVWRKLYLSLYSFSGQYTIEPQADGDRVLLLNATLRDLPPEDFPYPFWHSADKWRAYQQARQIALVFRKDRLIASYRAGLDTTIAATDRHWDGNWQWQQDGVTLPRPSLYDYTLSKANPERAGLENAYRDFEAAARPYNCNGCHNPANPRGVNPLVFFTHPAQALAGRHEIVAQLQQNKMPPPDGIKDETARQKLIDLAKRFAEEGDRALAFEQRQASK